MNCPLCLSENSEFFDQDKIRSYFLCKECLLVFVPRNQLINLIDEKRRYELHQNSEFDSAYLQYMEDLYQAIEGKLSNQEIGLDFGCGKVPLLEKLFKRKGFEFFSFDLYFHPNQEIFYKKFNFIIMSEVIEHLRDLNGELEKITNLLAPGGRLFIKTKLMPKGHEDFKSWYYKRDITHIQFFSESSLQKISQRYRLSEILFLKEDLFYFEMIAEK